MPPPPARLASVAAACLGWLFSAVDIVLLILFQRQVAEALSVEPQAVRIAIGVGLLGSALGGVAFAQLGDRFGRVRVLGWCVLLYSVATAGMAASPNVAVLMALRFVAGVGTGGEWSLGFALIAEVWPGGRRGAIGGLVGAMFNLGTFLAVGLYHSGLGWRGAFAVMAAPALLVLWLRRSVPESPVWTELQEARRAGRVAPELEAAMRRVPVRALFAGRLAGVTLKATLLFSLMNLAFYAFSTVFINYLQLEPAEGGLGLATREELPYQLALNVVTLVGIVTAGVLSDRLGRRFGFSLFCLLGGLGSAWLLSVTSGVVPGAGAPPWLLPALCAVCLGYGINGIVGPLSSELFPTHLRSTGPGFCQNLGKGIGGMAGPPLAGALVPGLGFPLVLALPGVVVLVLAALVWTLPAVGGREVAAVEDEGFLGG